MSRIAIIGSGVVGSATGKGLAQKGHEVIFVDVDMKTIEILCNSGFTAYTPDELKGEGVDAFFISVPTPTVGGAIDLVHIRAAAKTVGERLKTESDYSIVVVRSTVVPGATEKDIIPILEGASGKKAGKDFGVCMNPEYLRYELQKDGGPLKDFVNPWIIIIGELDERSGAVLENIYKAFECPVYRMSIQEAEMEKYIHNIWNATKIAFFNEMREVCKKAGVDAQKTFELVVESAEGSWNPRYGIRDLGPFSGPCLPKDAQAFLRWAEENLNMELPILRTIILTNEGLRKNIK